MVGSTGLLVTTLVSRGLWRRHYTGVGMIVWLWSWGKGHVIMHKSSCLLLCRVSIVQVHWTPSNHVCVSQLLLRKWSILWIVFFLPGMCSLSRLCLRCLRFMNLRLVLWDGFLKVCLVSAGLLAGSCCLNNEVGTAEVWWWSNRCVVWERHSRRLFCHPHRSVFVATLHFQLMYVALCSDWLSW